MTSPSDPALVDAFLLPRAQGVAPYYLRPSTPLELEREEKLRRVLRAERPPVPALPGCSVEQSEIHARALKRVTDLMHCDPAPETDAGRELLALVAVVEFYERGCLKDGSQ